MAFPTPSRQLISSGSAFEAEIGYSRAVVDGDFVFVSGCTGYDYKTGAISGDVAEQAEQCMVNIAAALSEAGAALADVVRVRYMLPDRDDFPKTWPVLRRWLGEVRPAATMMVAGLMKEEMRIEVEVTARRRGGGTGFVEVAERGRREGGPLLDKLTQTSPGRRA